MKKTLWKVETRKSFSFFLLFCSAERNRKFFLFYPYNPAVHRSVNIAVLLERNEEIETEREIKDSFDQRTFFCSMILLTLFPMFGLIRMLCQRRHLFIKSSFFSINSSFKVFPRTFQGLFIFNGRCCEGDMKIKLGGWQTLNSPCPFFPFDLLLFFRGYKWIFLDCPQPILELIPLGDWADVWDWNP